MTNIELLRKIHAGANDYYRPDDEIVCHIAVLRSWLDREKPEDIAYIFDPLDERFYDRLYTMDPFIRECEQIIENNLEESYFSINSYWRNHKQTEDIRHLNAFALDFDFYKIKEFKSLSPTEMYEMHIKPALPMKPTAVLDSGRGLYVLYVFHHCSIVRLKLYQAIYKAFFGKFKDYGMDAAAMNVTQVIRIPGSYNAKADKTVEIIESHPTEYEITDFCELLPYTQEETRVHFEKKRKRLQKKREKNHKDHNDRKKKCKSFLKDLSQLIAIRNHHKIYEGYRETLIYLALEKMMWAGYDKELAIAEAEKLNAMFHWPLKGKSVEKQCMPSKIYSRCNSISKAINKLSISAEEQRKMEVLVTRERRDLQKKRLRNKHLLLNRTKKEVDLLRRRTYVIKLKTQGRRNTEIAKSLDVDKSTITNDLKYINTHRHEFRKVLGDTIEALVESIEDKRKIRTVIYDEQIRLRKWVEISAEVLYDP